MFSRKVWSEKCCDQHCRRSRAAQLHLHVLRLHPPQLCQRALPCKEIYAQNYSMKSHLLLFLLLGETEEVWGCQWRTLFRVWLWWSEPILDQSTRLLHQLIRWHPVCIIFGHIWKDDMIYKSGKVCNGRCCYLTIGEKLLWIA